MYVKSLEVKDWVGPFCCSRLAIRIPDLRATLRRKSETMGGRFTRGPFLREMIDDGINPLETLHLS